MREKTKTAKKIRVGTVIFYVLYALGILAFFLGLNWGVRTFGAWLTDYEAAQPNVKCSQVFKELFAQPDWEALYHRAGCQDTTYENAAHYRVYMQQKLGDGQLQYHETSAGLSNDKKYVVTLQAKKIATFTLTSQKTGETGIPDWELGDVEVFFSREEDVRILTDPDCKVYVNGVELGQEHVTQTLHTTAEEYLPEDIHGLRQQWMYLDGLLVPPQVTAVDGTGQPVELTYDAETNTYAQDFPSLTISQDQMDFVEKAAKTYCRFMISQEGVYELGKVFDKNSQIYSTIRRRESWLHENKGYRFSEPVFSNYYRYSDTLYSVILTMTMEVKRMDSTMKEFPLQSTFFLQQQEDGKWLVSDMTNVDVQQTTTMVRLQYWVNGQQVHTEMVNAAADSLTLPEITEPDGKTFTGWYQQQKDENGQTIYALIFLPDEQGVVNLPGDQMLESMTLHALFQ